MRKTIEFCTYYTKNGAVLVNATNHILRIIQKDGITVEIPASVLPEVVPESYIIKARKLGVKVEDVCDSSIFIDVKKIELQKRKFVYYDAFTSEGAMDIIGKIQRETPDGSIIIGSTNAARAFPRMVVEPVYLLKNHYFIQFDKFKSYEM